MGCTRAAVQTYMHAKLTCVSWVRTLTSLQERNLPAVDMQSRWPPRSLSTSGDEISLLYGLQEQGEAYLSPTSRPHRAQAANQSIKSLLFANQAVFASCEHAEALPMLSFPKLNLLEGSCFPLFASGISESA